MHFYQLRVLLGPPILVQSKEAFNAYVFLTSKYDPYAIKSLLSDNESDLLVDLVGSDNCGIFNTIDSVELYRVVYAENFGMKSGS